ncbi:undecaprenyl-phosphate glucose phosphotransferase [Marinobacter sp. SS21]|nr:undecaprenyl-phosphate glucose phosphotransferase [Marinobacter sp. SS21]MDC0661796.1 undecaprenyl-phosphate glucose phosphotransferase [Marinobacter sp. SS21]
MPGSGPARLVFWLQWILANSLQVLVLVSLAVQQVGYLPPQYRMMIVATLLISIPLCTLFRVYSTQNGYLAGLGRILLAWLSLVSMLIFVAFITKTSDQFSRQLVVQWMMLAGGLQVAAFVPLHYLFKRLDRELRSARSSLIIGAGELAFDLAIKVRYERREQMLGMVALDDEPDFEVEVTQPYFPVIGRVSQLRSVLAENDVSRVYIALPAKETEQIEGLYVDLLDANVDVVWIPDFANLKLLNHSIQDLGGMPAIHLNESPLTSYPGGAFLKSLMDRSLALLGIAVLGPLLLAVAIAVKWSSPGPVLFRQQRHGWNGNIIEVLKFRSMRMHDDSEVKQATKEDPRVTSVGRFIRRTSIDELPQLFNVLKGDMSLVGPRPHAVAHNNYYSDKIIAYMARHRVKPGITGLAQISGYRGETETIDKMAKRVELDLDYISHWSLRLDLKILLKTPISLFSKNIY